MPAPLKIFSGNSNLPLALAICQHLGLSLVDMEVGRFPDGEISVKLKEDIRGSAAFLIQPICSTPTMSVNDSLVELQLMLDCLKRASARRITAVISYMGYARQDRKDGGRVPISAKVLADTIVTAGANRAIIMDLHSAQIQGFFSVPVDHIYGSKVLLPYFKALEIPQLTIVGPDIGSLKDAWAWVKRLDNSYLGLVEKRRLSPQEVETTFIIGPVEDRNILLVDDMIATGGTIENAVRKLKEKGAGDIYLAAIHPVFCGPAWERLGRLLQEGLVRQIVVTDTIPVGDRIPADFPAERLKILSVAGMLAEIIKRVNRDESVSSVNA